MGVLDMGVEEGFSERLVFLMIKEKVKNKDLMESCSVSNAAVSQWRSGNSKPKDFTCLAKAFSKDPEELRKYLLNGIEFEKDEELKFLTKLKNRVLRYFPAKNDPKDITLTARKNLERGGFQVTPFVRGKSNSLFLTNFNMWAKPVLNVYLPDLDITFVIDIYAPKKLGVSRNLDNKFQEFLFVKESDVENILEIVNNHIEKWFSR
jgi:transcriptional regulator with XRE-family HTH domain